MEKQLTTPDLRELLDIERSARRSLYQLNETVQKRDLDCLFHPSSFGYCTRKLQYHYLGEQPIHKISSATRSIFDLGHAVHDMLQARLERTLAYRFADSDYSYSLVVEHSINDTDLAQMYEMAGSADGLITLTTKDEMLYDVECARIVYEAKSISKKGWEKLTSPMAKHRMQASIYCEALEATHILFEYFCKDNAASKWFLIEKDKTAIDTALVAINKVRNATANLTLVDRDGSHYECSECQYLEICKPEGVPL